MRPILFSVLTLFAASAAFAAAAPSADMAWIRHVPGKESAAGYLTITSSAADNLTDVASECCERVEIHEMEETHGIMRMRRVDRVELPASTPVTFAPMGYHIMLIGLKQQPVHGATIPIKLTYDSGVSEMVPFVVKTVGAEAGAHDHGHH